MEKRVAAFTRAASRLYGTLEGDVGGGDEQRFPTSSTWDRAQSVANHDPKFRQTLDREMVAQ
jgi:hypothetical protein